MSWTWKILLVLSIAFTCNCASNVNVTTLVGNMLAGYNSQLRPNYNGPPLSVGITMYFLQIYGISEKDMHFFTDFYFRQYWKDERLAFDQDVGSLHLKHTDIWTPDTFFPTSKKTWFNYAMHQNIFTRINPDGNVLHSARLSGLFSCGMNFALYPMDTQLCAMEIESYGLTQADIKYHFRGSGGVGFSPDLSNSALKLIGYRLKTKNVYLSIGNYSRLSVEVAFQRSLQPYILDVYIPAALIVILSWLSFWLGMNKTARITLGLISTFILVEMMLNVNSNVPKFNVTTAMDVYLFVCLLMSAFTLIEFAAVYLLHSEDMKCDKPSDPELSEKWLSFVCNIDKYSKIAFPVLFTLFNLLYWIITTTVSDVEITDLIEI